MSDTNGKPFDVGRVIATLDATSHDLDVLAAAVELATRLNVEVAGLFVEDINLIRLLSLPVARHLILSSAGDEPSMEQMEREMKDLASRAADVLEASAHRLGLPWSFRVVRGSPEGQLLAATVPQDLLVIGATPDVAGLPFRLGSPLQRAVRLADRSAVHLPRRSTLGRPLAVVLAGSPLLYRTIEAAIRIGTPRHDVEIAVIGTAPAAERAKAEIAARLESRRIQPRFWTVDGSLVAQLDRAVSRAGSDFLVVAADVLELGGEELQEGLIQGERPLMVVR